MGSTMLAKLLLTCFFTILSSAVATRCLDTSDNDHMEILENTEMVETKIGRLIGKREIGIDTRQNKTVNWTAFYDIPYALPPLGDLRFKPPVPAESWSCLRDASFTENKICPQININITLSGLVNGGLDQSSDEDCLYLNVYVPDTNSTALLPVMFWIHGGGYIFGSGRSAEYGPLYYLAHDIIVVSIRYRLCPLGFLSLGTPNVPG